MRLKNPGGQIAWLMPLMAVGGIYVGYVSWMEGNPFLAAIFGTIGVLSSLVWFDQKWVALPLIGFCFLAIALGSIVLYLQGFSFRRVVKLIALCYTIYELWEWRHSPGDYEQSEEEIDDEADEPEVGEFLLSPVPKNIYASTDDADFRR
jgi:hypothetical protein